jgi:hypothetical protein
MESPTREWSWSWEGYRSVRLFVLDILPPTRDQIVSHVQSVVAGATSVQSIEETIHAFPSPYLPIQFQVATDRTPADLSQKHLDIQVRVKRR